MGRHSAPPRTRPGPAVRRTPFVGVGAGALTVTALLAFVQTTVLAQPESSSSALATAPFSLPPLTTPAEGAGPLVIPQIGVVAPGFDFWLATVANGTTRTLTTEILPTEPDAVQIHATRSPSAAVVLHDSAVPLTSTAAPASPLAAAEPAGSPAVGPSSDTVPTRPESTSSPTATPTPTTTPPPPETTEPPAPTCQTAPAPAPADDTAAVPTTEVPAPDDPATPEEPTCTDPCAAEEQDADPATTTSAEATPTPTSEPTPTPDGDTTPCVPAEPATGTTTPTATPTGS